MAFVTKQRGDYMALSKAVREAQAAVDRLLATGASQVSVAVAVQAVQRCQHELGEFNAWRWEWRRQRGYL